MIDLRHVLAILLLGTTTAFAADTPVLNGADAFGDWKTDRPGVRRMILPKDLPEPYATGAAASRAVLAPLPAGTGPQLPPGFKAELLIDKLGVSDVGAFFPHAVTLHTSCHALRSLHLGTVPVELLRHVGGLTLIDLDQQDECCGFGGTFSIKNPEVSAAMVSNKVRCVLNTGAEVCTAVDNSCLMHIGGALSRQRTGVRTLHLAEILASSKLGDET